MKVGMTDKTRQVKTRQTATMSVAGTTRLDLVVDVGKVLGSQLYSFWAVLQRSA